MLHVFILQQRLHKIFCFTIQSQVSIVQSWNRSLLETIYFDSIKASHLTWFNLNRIKNPKCIIFFTHSLEHFVQLDYSLFSIYILGISITLRNHSANVVLYHCKNYSAFILHLKRHKYQNDTSHSNKNTWQLRLKWPFLNNSIWMFQKNNFCRCY